MSLLVRRLGELIGSAIAAINHTAPRQTDILKNRDSEYLGMTMVMCIVTGGRYAKQAPLLAPPLRAASSNCWIAARACAHKRQHR
jgi:hypothetical protein